MGCSISAYQAEGAYQEDGKQPSIIDKYQHTEGVANFEVASDFTITIKKIYSCLKN